MGWEKGGRYYTRSRRVDGRVVREYIGSGSVAELMSAMDEERHADRDAQRRAWREEQRRIRELEDAADELDRLCSLLMHAELEAAGYHQHDRGEWRKRRV